jgi:hypothetical protein
MASRGLTKLPVGAITCTLAGTCSSVWLSMILPVSVAIISSAHRHDAGWP